MHRPLTETDWLQYEISEKLNELETDPEGRPFQSKYEARQTLSRLRTEVIRFAEDIQNKEDGDVLIAESALATFNYEIAQNFNATDERPAAETSAKEALERIETFKSANKDLTITGLKTAFISAEIALRNTLGCIYCERTDSEAAISSLVTAEEIYQQFMTEKTDDTPAPWELKRPVRWVCGVVDNVEEQFSINEDPWKTFENLHTHTLYYLAQAFKLDGKFSLAAKYCEKTLARQLRGTSYFDPIDWSVNAATLSVYYVGSNIPQTLFRARHCLAAATTVLSLVKSDGTDDKCMRAKADIDRCWAKLGLAVLESSRSQLDKENENESEKKHPNESSENGNTSDELSSADDLSAYLPNMVKYENEMTCQSVTTFAQAREVFLQVQRHITAAQSFYTLNDHATDHAELALDYSQAYTHLIFFESDVDRKCKMHKRRIDSLAAVYKELNPTYYLIIRRKIGFELGEIYNEMLDLKVGIVDESGRDVPTVHQIAKINMLARSGIKYLHEYLASMGALEKSDEKFDTTDLRGIILAHIYCAKMFRRLLTDDIKEKIANLTASLSESQWIVDYMDRVDPSAKQHFEREYDAYKANLILLPRQIDRMKSLLNRNT